MHRFLEHGGPIPFAHRGGAGEHPENTWPAFEHAAALGYRYFETDAHATADGVVVAFHDDALDRLTDRQGVIEQLSWDEVRRARVRGKEPIVRLDELLGEFPNARVNIDAKHGRVVEPLVDVLHRTQAHDRVCIAAFSDRRLARLRQRLGPGVCMAAGPRGVLQLRLRSMGVTVPSPPVRCVQVPVLSRGVTIVNERFVESSHHSGVAVHVWTVDDEREMHRLLDLGVDGIMTDRPAVLRDVLQSRGAWV